jgi:hypothetical protein
VGFGHEGAFVRALRTYVFNTKNVALRAHRLAHQSFADASGEINAIEKKPKLPISSGKSSLLSLSESSMGCWAET